MASNKTILYFIPYDKNGDLVLLPEGKEIFESSGQFSGIVNPLLDLQNATDETKTYNVLVNIYAQYSPIKEVTIKTIFSPTYNKSRNGFFI